MVFSRVHLQSNSGQYVVQRLAPFKTLVMSDAPKNHIPTPERTSNQPRGTPDTSTAPNNPQLVLYLLRRSLLFSSLNVRAHEV